MTKTARKAIASFVTVLSGWSIFVLTSKPGHVTGPEWGLLIGGATTVFVTWLVPNDTPAPWRPPALGDGGQSAVSVLLVVLLVLVILRVLGLV